MIDPDGPNGRFTRLGLAWRAEKASKVATTGSASRGMQADQWWQVPEVVANLTLPHDLLQNHLQI